MRTRIKICGITRPGDGLAAARLGADAVGLVFYQNSPRAVDVKQARAIVRVLPPFVTVVGLFVDAEHFFIEDVLAHVRIDLLQFHGEEAPADCAGYACPYIKAIRMHEGLDVVALARRYDNASGLLLDTYSEHDAGGTGRAFDWMRVPRGLDRPIILAGGLNAENVGTAVQQVRPYAVDVSSGVESSKGIKDVGMLAAFIAAVSEAGQR